MPKQILFITGTRADFGKLKPLIRTIADCSEFSYAIFVTGMHTLKRYGLTASEVGKAGFQNIYQYINQIYGEPMEQVLANTIIGLSRYVHEYNPDLIVTHGDRVEALASAIVGVLRNTLVAHVEGGELSGTVDEVLRHSASKLSHIHFAANQEAAKRLTQLGEDPESIYIIGSPDIDVMLSSDLPAIGEVKQYYGIPFARYSILMFHPVTTELSSLSAQVQELVAAVLESGKNYVVIYPNNDEGCDIIFAHYAQFEGKDTVKLFPSVRFEYFLSLLKHTDFILGNSSAGIREAPVYAVPTINVGTRQQNRFTHDSIVNVRGDRGEILDAIRQIADRKPTAPSRHFGQGNSDKLFLEALREDKLWQTATQKRFHDLE